MRPRIPLVGRHRRRAVGAALAPHRPRRRHDAAGQACSRARPGRGRPARRAPAARLACSSRPRTARRPPRRWSRRSSRPRVRLVPQPRRRQPALRRRLDAARRPATRELGLFEVRRGRAARGRPPRAPARAACSGNLFRDQLDRYGELELVAERWRALVAGLAARTLVVANADDPRSATSRADARAAPALRPRRPAARAPRRSQHAADSTFCVRCGAAVRRTRPSTSATSATTAARAAATHGRTLGRRRARRSSSDGLEGVEFQLVAPEGVRAGAPRRCPGSTTSTTPSRPPPWRSRWTSPLAEVVAGLERFAPPSGASSGSRSATATLVAAAGQEPGRRQRGAADTGRGEARRTSSLVALNDEHRRRPRRLVDLGRRLRAAARGLEHARGDGRARRRARPARASTRGFDAGAHRGRARPGAARSTAALELTPAGGTASRSPPTPRCSSCSGIVGRARATPSRYWEAGGMKLRSATSTPSYLNIYADRGNIAVLERRCGLARDRALGRRRSASATTFEPGATTSIYVGGGQDRDQALIAPDLRRQGRGAARGVARRGRRARRLRRLPAARRLLPGHQRRGAARRGPPRPVHGRRRDADDRRLPARVRARAPASSRTLAGFENHAGRTYLEEGAEPLGRVIVGLRQRRRERLRGLPGRSGGRARTCTARCSHGTRGSPTGCWRRRWATPRAARRLSWSRSETSSRSRRTPSRRRGLGRAGASNSLLLGRPERPEIHHGVTGPPAGRGSAGSAGAGRHRSAPGR